MMAGEFRVNPLAFAGKARVKSSILTKGRVMKISDVWIHPAFFNLFNYPLIIQSHYGVYARPGTTSQSDNSCDIMHYRLYLYFLTFVKGIESQEL